MNLNTITEVRRSTGNGDEDFDWREGDSWRPNKKIDGYDGALYERMVFDEEGRVVNPTLRNYRIPAFADVPRTEVIFADTHDTLGPLAAKGMGECPINPVAPALANALADATGLRFRDLPFTPDRIYRRIYERHVV